MRAVALAVLTACVAAAASMPEYALFDSVLERVVLDNGKVRYGQLKNDPHWITSWRRSVQSVPIPTRICFRRARISSRIGSKLITRWCCNHSPDITRKKRTAFRASFSRPRYLLLPHEA